MASNWCGKATDTVMGVNTPWQCKNTAVFGCKHKTKLCQALPFQVSRDVVCTRVYRSVKWRSHCSKRAQKIVFKIVYLVTLVYRIFCSCDLDLDPMTLTYERDLDMPKMYPHTTNEVSRLRLSNTRAQRVQTDRQTDTRTYETEHITTTA